MYDVSNTTVLEDGPRWCPVCAVVLKPFERNGVEMDFCPQCLGVWLDQGELDVLIRRSVTIQVAEPSSLPPVKPPFAFCAP
ncbi:MAG: zf-TFIIB domain-containing protein [Capsulimonadales bacterium]|nr:zf-TFIIB domain-containing protein [Capsulimonadales bacterium]